MPSHNITLLILGWLLVSLPVSLIMGVLMDTDGPQDAPADSGTQAIKDTTGRCEHCGEFLGDWGCVTIGCDEWYAPQVHSRQRRPQQLRMHLHRTPEQQLELTVKAEVEHMLNELERLL